MNDNSILKSVPRRLKLARLALVWELAWPRLFPPLAVIGAFLVLPGKAEPHGHDGYARLVVEFLRRHPHPVSQAIA